MVRVRFAPSPTGSLHLGGALSAVAVAMMRARRATAPLLRVLVSPAMSPEPLFSYGPDAIVYCALAT